MAKVAGITSDRARRRRALPDCWLDPQSSLVRLRVFDFDSNVARGRVYLLRLATA